MDRTLVNKITILIIILLVSAIFLSMIRQFLMVILLAGIFSSMAQPLFHTFERWFHGRKSLASLITLLIIFLMIFLPLAGLLGIVAGQAISISQSVMPWVQHWINEPSSFNSVLVHVPFHEYLIEYQNVILQRAGQFIGGMSAFLFNSISSITITTLYSIFLFFVFLYTMFFFLQDGRAILNRFLFYLPLPEDVEKRLLERFTSVTRAAIKGTLVIGVIQGSLGGLAFWIIGIDSAVFWGTVMTFLSIIPAIGPAGVWFPAVIILAISGTYVKAVVLLIFGSLLVGTIDNLLRPWLVGRDIKMHELLIFFSTLGGIGMFGLVGFIIGPIIAALFVTIWEIYGENFEEYLKDKQTGE